jgi:hypothetical protein
MGKQLMKFLMRRNLFLLAFVFLALIASGCNLYSQAPADVPTPTLTAAVATAQNLNTYTNAKHGFTFQYPTGLALSEDASKDYLFLDDQIFMTVTTFNPEEARGDAPVIESKEALQVGSFAARRLRGYEGSVGGGTPQRYESIVIPHNGKFYIFTAFELKRNVTLPENRQLGPVPADVLNLLYQILSTLRFAT